MSSSVISKSGVPDLFENTEEVGPFLPDDLFWDRPPGAFLFGLAVDWDAWDVDGSERGRLRVCMICNKILEAWEINGTIEQHRQRV